MRNRGKKFWVYSILIILFFSAGILCAFAFNPAWLFRTAAGEEPGAFDQNRVNIALLGFDRSAERDQSFTIYRPDTILIASINFQSGAVSMVNIPRDSYVAIAGTGIDDKINHAYMYGYNEPGSDNPHQNGIDATLDTIEDFLGGVPIHYYVILDMDGVVEIVDQIGGIDYEVEYPVRADFGRGDLMLDKGFQRLNGRDFLTYVRDRSVDGDTGRSRRQQQILIATFAQLKKQGRLTDIPAIYRSLKQNVETNLSPAQITSLTVFGARINPEQIQTYVFPGSIQFAPRGELDISYIVIDEQARVELVDKIFGRTVERRTQITLPGRRKPEPVVQIEQPEELPPREPVTPPAEPVPGERDHPQQPDLPGESPNPDEEMEESI